jgi:uncharacterized protein YlzI (FlbEa/FlbD family)
MIKLTLENGNPILINIAQVHNMRTEDRSDGTLTCIDGEIYVRESLDDILNLQVAASHNC